MLTHEEYATLVEQAPIMIWRADLTKGCDYFNERWLAFTGRTLEQERGNGWAEGVHPEDFGRCLEIYTTSFDARRSFEMEYRLRRHDGAWRWIFDRGVPSFDAAGAFLGFIGSCVDVTERIEAQRELEARRQAELTELRELVPICMHCKRVRDDNGFWGRVEAYVERVTKKAITTGICADCMRKHHPEVSESMETSVEEPPRGR